VNVNHVVPTMKFEKEMDSFVKEDVVKQPTKKRPNIFETSI
jgi:hypothetical protein